MQRNTCLFMLCFFLRLSAASYGALQEEFLDDCFSDGFNLATSFDQGEYGGFLSKSFLIWRAEGDNFSPGLLRGVTASEQTRQILLEDAYQLGFDLSAGYRFLHGDWQLELGYRYFRSHIHSPNTQLRETSSEEIIPFWGHYNQNLGIFFSEESSWKLHTYIFDGHLMRRYYVGEALIFLTQMGFRSLILDQKYDATYQSGFAILDTFTKADSWNFGPRTCIRSDWFLGSGLRVFGQAGASIAYTKYHVEHNEKSDVSSTIFRISDDRYCICPTAELGAGIGWGAAFMQRTFHLDLALSYDLMVLYGQNFMKSFLEPFVENFSRGGYDLYFHGFTFTMRSDF